MKKLWPSKTTAGYVGVLAGCFAIAISAGWIFGPQIDSYAYDFLFNLNPPPPTPTQAVVVAIDDASFEKLGGVRRVRGILADAAERVAAANPAVVATDIILHDKGDPAEDSRLAAALAKLKPLVLATNLTRSGWDDPLPAFARSARELGTVSADEVSPDGVTRFVALAKTGLRRQHWELALQAFRLARGAKIIESPDALQIGPEVIPARANKDWSLRILYSREGVPQIPAATLLNNPALAARLKGKAVFLGVTSPLFAGDRVVTPNGDGMISGLELNAEVFKTLERGKFLTDVSDGAVFVFCALIALLAGCIFVVFAGWPAYLAGAALLAAVSAAPFFLFRDGIVLPTLAPLASAWLTVAGAASYRSLVVGRQLRAAQVERARYRQAIHFVTHEMRSPLMAIQGSSEMMGRYNLNEDKRRQMAAMINSESKRLARMIQTFLDVERLTDNQMELKREPVAMETLVRACLERVRPLSERKNITLTVAGPLEGQVSGDRELLEYAVYNLLTNAVKYSPPETDVIISARRDSGFLRLSVKDQGMGMDAGELKRIFTRFYRTSRAEASGEAGTGIGLSIVDQIVKLHGGRVEVTSAPGKGSIFTLVAPAMEAPRTQGAVEPRIQEIGT